MTNTPDGAKPSPQSAALLPCPFCGGAATLDHLSDHDSHFVRCLDCEVQQIAAYLPHVAARRWNERRPRAPGVSDVSVVAFPEFDCIQCGLHIVRMPAIPGPPVCALCQTMPSWRFYPDLRKLYDPEGLSRDPDPRDHPEARGNEDQPLTWDDVT